MPGFYTHPTKNRFATPLCRKIPFLSCFLAEGACLDVWSNDWERARVLSRSQGPHETVLDAVWIEENTHAIARDSLGSRID